MGLQTNTPQGDGEQPLQGMREQLGQGAASGAQGEQPETSIPQSEQPAGEACDLRPAGPAPEISLRNIFDHVVRIFCRLGPAGPLALLAASTPALSGFILLGSMPWLAPWLQEQGPLGVFLYIGVYAVLGGLSLMPTYAHALLGGWAFGLALGLPVAMAAFGLAAMLGYFIGRQVTGERVTQLIRENPKSQAVYDALIGKGAARSFGIITLLRIPPSSPFAITNLTLAAVRANPAAYLCGTLLGMLPRTAAVVFLAAGLKEAMLTSPRNRAMIIAGIVATLIALGVIGYLANQALAKVTQPQASHNNQDSRGEHGEAELRKT